MATIRLRKNKDGTAASHQYQAIVRKKNRATGLLHNESQTFESEREAREWAASLEADLRRAIHTDTRLIDKTQLGELIKKYIDEVSPGKLGGDREIVRLKTWLKHPISELMLSRASPKHFADYVSERRKTISKRGGLIADQTIKLDLISLSNVFEVGRKDWGYGIDNPIKKISMPGGSKTREVRIVEENWKKIEVELKKCRNPLYVAISELGIETGMRQDELFRMCWGDFNLVGNRKNLIVDGKDTSGTGKRKKRTVPLSARAFELIKTLPGFAGEDLETPILKMGKGASSDGLSRAFTAACKKIGLKGGVFHSTRHEAASRMAQHYPLLTLMKIFGWKTPGVAAGYYKADIEELHAGLDKMLSKSKK